MPIKYLGDQSAGQPFATEETKSVVVTEEALDKSSGYEGETVVYTATLKDNLAAALPATFVVDLKMNGIDLGLDRTLDPAIYDPVTFLFTLPWVVPAGMGSFTVKLSWPEQII